MTTHRLFAAAVLILGILAVGFQQADSPVEAAVPCEPTPPGFGVSFAFTVEAGGPNVGRFDFNVPLAQPGMAIAVRAEFTIVNPTGGNFFYDAEVRDTASRVHGDRIGFAGGSVGLALEGRKTDSGFGFATNGVASVRVRNSVNQNGGPLLQVAGTLRMYEIPPSAVNSGEALADFTELLIEDSTCIDPLGLGLGVDDDATAASFRSQLPPAPAIVLPGSPDPVVATHCVVDSANPEEPMVCMPEQSDRDNYLEALVGQTDRVVLGTHYTFPLDGGAVAPGPRSSLAVLGLPACDQSLFLTGTWFAEKIAATTTGCADVITHQTFLAETLMVFRPGLDNLADTPVGARTQTLEYVGGDPLGSGIEPGGSFVLAPFDAGNINPDLPACVARVFLDNDQIVRGCFATTAERAAYLDLLVAAGPRPANEIFWIGAADQEPVRP